MQIINLTPHDINVVLPEGIRTFPKSGAEARATPERLAGPTVDGMPSVTVTLGDVTGLPEPAEGTIYLVSMVIVDKLPEREDIFAPGELVRDPDGRVIGCRGLARSPRVKR
jgi:hypothetical protein